MVGIVNVKHRQFQESREGYQGRGDTVSRKEGSQGRISRKDAKKRRIPRKENGRISRKEERKDIKEGSSDRLVGPARSLTGYPLALANPPGNVPVCLFFKARSRQDEYHMANQRAWRGEGGWDEG
jgi:hypothetical protein